MCVLSHLKIFPTMKNLIKIALPLLAAVVLTACGNGGVTKVSSHGSPYELIIVSSHDNWQGELGDTLRSVMSQPIPYLMGQEPMFNVLRIQPSAFKDFITKHRNVMIVNVDSKYENPSMTAAYDMYSAPQIIVSVTGPTVESLTDYVSQYREELQANFNIAERDRYVARVSPYSDKQLDQKVKDKFGFDIKLVKGFKLRNEADNFMWISFEYPQSSQGLVIYSYPYSDRSDFSEEALLARREEFVSKIPGQNEGSHMITVTEYPPYVTHMRIHGRYWAEMRGFWDVKNDFMGGPFVSYSTLDTQNNRVVTLDFYVYSPAPSNPKRNYIRDLESLMFTVSFPGDKEITEGQAE